MNLENLLIATAQPEFAQAALAELRNLDRHCQQREELTPGVLLCESASSGTLMHKAAVARPIFVRHLAPVQTIVKLQAGEQDIATLVQALAGLPAFALLERGTHFAVQSRLVQNSKTQVTRPYSSGQLNRLLAEAIAEETGAIESVKKPRVVVSILCTTEKGFLGISTVEENLSSWPGGARHFAQTEEQISRAEFKLLEALEVFSIALPVGEEALDLGAAPGGWTRLLLDAGLSVVAVDPARLDARLTGHPHLQHYHGYAENYLEEAIHSGKCFAIIVNDMRMDAREAARLLGRAARCLRQDGIVISVFKLPHATREIRPLANLREALNILHRHYGLVQVRQLFHNRQEVTAVAAQPLVRKQ
ncbi:MAG: hypothetical protein IMW89_09225 [Ktedonobacteraceae bacterium]|nr:hypothetical protein [Ktedonobacteraceae bacterium]